jgi:hypothetical protein
MSNALHSKRFNEIRSAEIRAEEIIDTLNPPIPGDFVGKCFRDQIIYVMNFTYQVKNIPIKIDYKDTRKNLMTEFLPPPQLILSNIATAAEEVVLEQQKITYNTDDPKLTKFQNEQRRHILAIMNKQVELLRNPENLKELADIYEKTKNQKPRERPSKTQPNFQPEETDWSAQRYDPWNNSQITKTQES